MFEIPETLLSIEWENVSYSNPLFQNLQLHEFDQEKFSHYKKNLQTIFQTILQQIGIIYSLVANDSITNTWDIDQHFISMEKECKHLNEYCYFFWQIEWKIPLSYESLWTIAHKHKMTAETLKSFLTLNMLSVNENTKMENLELLEIWKNGIEDAYKTVSNLTFNENSSSYKESLFSPSAVSQKIIAFQWAALGEREILLENRLPSDQNIKSYQGIFEIVMENLLTNAIKFTPTWGKITRGIEKEDSDIVTFFVQNSWTGIPPEVDVFARGYTTSWLQGEQWTWLGLQQCKIFLETVQWSISHRNAPTWGTIFSFTLSKEQLKNAK